MPHKIIEISLAEACTTTAVRCADGIHTEAVRIFKAGMQTGHHSHVYDHTTVIVRGAVEAWAGGKRLGEFREMESLLIKAGVKHHFRALEDDTTFVCIHNVSRSGVIETIDEFKMKDFA